MAQLTTGRPRPGVLYGITHTVDGELIIREPKIIKAGIGLPKGPALNVWIQRDQNGVTKWKIRLGYKDGEARTLTCDNRAAAEEVFFHSLPSAPNCPYPRKIGFFTFTRPVIQDGAEQFVPDFDAIEAHGPTPTEIDIVLIDDQPFSGAYQMWSASELRCKGDGVDAMRTVTMATAEQKQAAEAAIASGEKYFPMRGCWTQGCPHAKETMRNGKPQPSACKPGGDLKFQLARNIRVGGTAYFHTTGYRSISSIFSSLHRIGTLTGGRLAGIPLKMVLRPFRTNHNGQAATQYAVSLEFRAPDVATLRQKLLETVFEFRQVAGIEAPAPKQPVRLIEQASPDLIEDSEDEPPISAAAMADEYYPDAGDEPTCDAPADPQSATVTSASAPVAATEQKTAGLAERMRASRARKTQDPAPATPTTAPQTTLAGQDTTQQGAPAAPTNGSAPHDATSQSGDFF